MRSLGLPNTTREYGDAFLHDATKPPPDRLAGNVRLVFSSPPYLQVMEYGKYNWVRLWFLGDEWREVDRRLMSTGSLPKYMDFMDGVLTSLRRVVAADGFVALVIGDVRSRGRDLRLAHIVRDEVALAHGWHCHGVIVDRVPQRHKVSRIWKTAGRATKTDRILLLSPADRPLPPLGPIRWANSTFPLTED
jgi:hypothetical protein